MPESLTIDFDRPLPVFPLPRCVLLPHATTPLHVFEPRYRAMVSDALDSLGLIAMAVFAGEGYKTDYEGAPPIREHVCLGRIARHQPLPDGRYHILLHGLCRARVQAEANDPDLPYRTAYLQPTETAESMEIDFAEPRAQLEQLLHDPTLGELSAVRQIHQWLSDEAPTPAVVDLAILTLVRDPEQRYTMLAEPDAQARARWLMGNLRQIRQTLQDADRLGPATEDGFNLN